MLLYVRRIDGERDDEDGSGATLPCSPCFTLSSMPLPRSRGDAAGDERILSYSSDIQVRRDASLDVTETIRIAARGAEFRHGLYRDFPTRYRRAGRGVEVGFEVASVTRDGRPEPWRTRARGRMASRIIIGDADTLLAPGTAHLSHPIPDDPPDRLLCGL